MFKEWRCSLAFVPFVSGSLLLQGIASSQFPQLALEACKYRTGWTWGALHDQEITRNVEMYRFGLFGSAEKKAMLPLRYTVKKLQRCTETLL